MAGFSNALIKTSLPGGKEDFLTVEILTGFKECSWYKNNSYVHHLVLTLHDAELQIHAYRFSVQRVP